MNLQDPAERALYAREVAALAAEGEDTTHIWMRLDISQHEVEEIYKTPEFEQAMRERGDELWEAWSLTRAEADSRQSAHQFILSHTEQYLQRLHDIAMSPSTKDETTARILLSFLESTKQLGPEVSEGTQVSLSPATIHLLNKGGEIFRRHPKPPVMSPGPDVPDHE